jgi:hypothetical protein
MECFLKNDIAQPATIGLEFRDWFGGSQSGDGYLTGPYLLFRPDGTVQADGGPDQASWIPVGRYDLGRWLRVEIEFEEGEGKPKTYTLRLAGADGSTTSKDGLPFRHRAFQLCTWCGFIGLDTKRAVFDVDDIHLE